MSLFELRKGNWSRMATINLPVQAKSITELLPPFWETLSLPIGLQVSGEKTRASCHRDTQRVQA